MERIEFYALFYFGEAMDGPTLDTIEISAEIEPPLAERVLMIAVICLLVLNLSFNLYARYVPQNACYILTPQQVIEVAPIGITP